MFIRVYYKHFNEKLNISFMICGQNACITHITWKVQPTVTFPIGDHVNVWHDYKKTGPSTILKRLTCRCHHLIGMVIEFSQNLTLLTHLKCLNVPYPSIFTNFCMNYYAPVPCGEKIAKNPSAYWNHLNMHSYTVNIFYQQSEITVPYIRL